VLTCPLILFPEFVLVWAEPQSSGRPLRHHTKASRHFPHLFWTFSPASQPQTNLNRPKNVPTHTTPSCSPYLTEVVAALREAACQNNPRTSETNTCTSESATITENQQARTQSAFKVKCWLDSVRIEGEVLVSSIGAPTPTDPKRRKKCASIQFIALHCIVQKRQGLTKQHRKEEIER